MSTKDGLKKSSISSNVGAAKRSPNYPAPAAAPPKGRTQWDDLAARTFRNKLLKDAWRALRGLSNTKLVSFVTLFGDQTVPNQPKLPRVSAVPPKSKDKVEVKPVLENRAARRSRLERSGPQAQVARKEGGEVAQAATSEDVGAQVSTATVISGEGAKSPYALDRGQATEATQAVVSTGVGPQVRAVAVSDQGAKSPYASGDGQVASVPFESILSSFPREQRREVLKNYYKQEDAKPKKIPVTTVNNLPSTAVDVKTSVHVAPPQKKVSVRDSGVKNQILDVDPPRNQQLAVLPWEMYNIRYTDDFDDGALGCRVKRRYEDPNVLKLSRVWPKIHPSEREVYVPHKIEFNHKPPGSRVPPK